jgi:hypothetical protein
LVGARHGEPSFVAAVIAVTGLIPTLEHYGRLLGMPLVLDVGEVHLAFA